MYKYVRLWNAWYSDVFPQSGLVVISSEKWTLTAELLHFLWKNSSRRSYLNISVNVVIFLIYIALENKCWNEFPQYHRMEQNPICLPLNHFCHKFAFCPRSGFEPDKPLLLDRINKSFYPLTPPLPIYCYY